MATIAEPFQLAVQFHQAGQRRHAESVLHDLLDQEPRHAPALHLLGTLAYEDGQLSAAADWFRQAVAAEPANAVFHSCLGAA